MAHIPEQIIVIGALSIVHAAIVAKESRKEGQQLFWLDALLNLVIAMGTGWLYWQAAVIGNTPHDVQLFAAGMGAAMGLQGIDKLRQEIPRLIARMIGR